MKVYERLYALVICALLRIAVRWDPEVRQSGGSLLLRFAHLCGDLGCHMADRQIVRRYGRDYRLGRKVR